MNFFTDDQREALESVQRSDPHFEEMLGFLEGPLAAFCKDAVAPQAAENDAAEVFSVENFKALGELGYLSIVYPSRYEGMESSFVYHNAGIESLAKADAGFTLGVAIHGTTSDGINRFGSERLKDCYLADLVQGRRIGAFALSEAGSGSDARSLATTYRREADRYVLNGSKYWITNGLSADVFFVVARDARDPERISAFCVTREGKGTFETHKILDKMGVRGSNTAELVFEDYEVNADHLIGEEGAGFKYAMQMLDGGRVTIASWSTGVAQGAYEKLLKYAHERRLFGGPLKDLDNTGRELSEMLIGIRAGRHLAYHAALLKDLGRPLTQAAACAKVFSSENAVRVGERCIELAGGYGYVADGRIERHLRDALLGRIGEGANELLKITVIPRIIFAAFEKKPLASIW